jgi:hypothetical protein
MTREDRIELFVLKCAVIEGVLRESLAQQGEPSGTQGSLLVDEKVDRYVRQFDLEIRKNAATMSRYYEIFHMLENDIRRLIAETLETAHGPLWWETHVPHNVKEEAKKNKAREEQAAVSIRSDEEIDYITFGQLWDVIRENWLDFAGMLSNQSAVGRVLSGLNMLRGTIAHCGVLADDEVDRLKLAIGDWFRVLQGPIG